MRRTLFTVPQEIQFAFNVQHDCMTGNCAVETRDRVIMQERLPVQCKLPTLVHKNDTHFIINMHALHNAQLLRHHLPRALTEPKHTHADRTALHLELASRARATRTTKRDQTAEKRAATTAARAAEAVVAGIPAAAGIPEASTNNSGS